MIIPYSELPLLSDRPYLTKKLGNQKKAFESVLRIIYRLLVGYHNLDKGLPKSEKFVEVPLKHWILQCGASCQTTHRIKTFLLENNIVEQNNSYKVGERSKGYRLHSDFISKDIIWRQDKTRSLIKADWEYIRNCNRSSFDREKALEYFNPQYAALVYRKTHVEGKPHYDVELNKVLIMDRIENADTSFHIASSNDRMVCTLNRIPQEFRQFIKHDGKPCCEIDVKNSQPLLASTLYRDATKAERSEHSLYRSLVEGGTFYEAFCEQHDITRANAKNRFLVSTFGKGDCAFLRSLFPILAFRLTEYKTKYGYKALAVHLQRLEAKAMVPISAFYETVCLHDSVMVAHEYMFEAKQKVMEAYKTLYNVNPTIKVTFHND